MNTLKKFASGALKTFQEPGALDQDGQGPTEASVYKSLLVDLQYNQLLISREYQELFKTKEEEIRRLKKLAGEPIDEDVSETGVVTPNKKDAQGAKPMKDLSAEDIKIVLREWERKMRTNIVQKTEALAEAQIYRESVELLRTQLDAMRETIKEQTAKITELEQRLKRSGNHDQARAEQEAGVQKLMKELSLMEADAAKTKEKLVAAEHEIQALRTKAMSDAQTLALLSQNATGDGAEVKGLLQQREAEHEQAMAALRSEFEDKHNKLEAELQRTVGELTEARKSMEALQEDLKNALAIQADMVSRTKSQAAEETQSAISERDDAIQSLQQKEVALKEAMDKLAKTELELQRLTKEHEEVVVSRNVSSQKDLEQKESALENTRQDLYAAQRAFDELKSSSESSAEQLKKKIAEKDLELEAINSKIEELEAEKNVLATKGAKSVEETAQIKSQMEAMSRTHAEELAKVKDEADSEQRRLSSELDRSVSEAKEATNKNKELTATLENSTARITTLSDDLASALKQAEQASQDKMRLEGELVQVRTELARVNAEMLDMKKQLEETAQRIERETERVRKECLEEQERRLKEQSEVHAAELAKARKEVAEYKDLYSKETVLRRQVHDELMDMKGNIRVFARVRPVLPGEQKMAEERDGPSGADIVTEFPPESGGRDLVIKREGPREGSDTKFEFDHVFDPSSTQEQVFETVAPFIISVMDGVNVTLFAYGQTGSGKTFTMQGTPENPGVNIRALQKVFALAQERSATYSYTFSVSVLEVYLDTILDLLGDVESKDAREKLDIRQHPDTKAVFVQGLVKRPVTNMKEVEDLLLLASKNRTVGAHNMNEHSSRSHLVFTLTATAQSLIKKEKIEGNLNLIDLAGSERVGKTEATGDRLKEAQAINKSLLALGDVINALALKNSHIPFRNSKLTYLLQDQLQGNAKVGFVANVSPTAFNCGETICTLNFASRCRKTELGKAKKNVVGSGDVEQLMKENARLKRQLDELQNGGASKADTSFSSTTQSTPVRTPSKALASSTGGKRQLEKD